MNTARKLINVFFFLLAVSLTGNKSYSQFAYRNIDNKAFTYGEITKFRVHYGIINAGRFEIRVDDRPVWVNGRPTYHIVAEGGSLKSYDWLFKVRDFYESYVDVQAIVPLKYTKSVQESNHKSSDFVMYYHETKKLSAKKGVLEIPVNTQDIVSSSFYARTIDFSKAYPGQVFPIDVYLDQKIYNLQFTYLGRETLNTDIGKVKAIKLRPKLVVDRTFKSEDDMTLWISDDENKIILRIKSDLAIGSIKVDLTDYSGLKNPFSAKIDR